MTRNEAPAYDREAAEQWFRRRGLPAVVRGRPTRLWLRIVPGEMYFVVQILTFGAYAAASDPATLGQRFEDDGFVAFYLALVAAVLVLPWVAVWLAARWVRRRMADHRGAAGAALMTVVTLVANVAAEAMNGPPRTVLADIGFGVLTLAVLFVAAFFGGGSILGWALRAAFRQISRLGDLAGRALPLLLLFSVFGFYTTEVWQITADLSRHKVWLVVGLFAVIAVLFLMSTLSDEVRTLSHHHQAPEPQTLDDTPFGGCTAGGAAREPLRRLERANLVLVLVLTQILQTLVLSVLTFVLFLVLGAITVTDNVVKEWIGRAPHPGTLFAVPVPLSNELIQVSLFISAFSALYFASAAVTDATYRQSFFEPLVRHMSTSVAARDIYLSRLDRRGRA